MLRRLGQPRFQCIQTHATARGPGACAESSRDTKLVRAIIEAGGNVICAGTVVTPGPFVIDLFEGGDAGPTDGRAVRDEETGDLVAPKTLGYGQLPTEKDLHIM